MASNTRKVAEIVEAEWTQAVKTILIGLSLSVAAGILLYFIRFPLAHHAIILRIVQIALGLVIFSGIGIAGAALYRAYQARNIKGVAYRCPYCDKPNKFEAEPDTNFDCDYCNHTVHFQDGRQVMVRTVLCPFCSTQHRVAANVQRYMCDRCNRAMELGVEMDGRPAPQAETKIKEPPLQNYDVLLVAIDRRQENELALKLQSLMIVTLPEARRLMGAADTATPLIVGHDLPQRKAESIRRQLQELGATVTLRPNTGQRPAAQTAR